ncbi:hypothetical protein K458DRAFT_64111 [Lentithecium fluviatile CBS 122367]|uniref:Uncharacterized protein n=1 Tax=Lentithecium fluviatile CBS 122367 TaxID=1168545 RepID=A0A6G1JL74_9PLEO|nr:hypothetical protein K458DRAFT_64111 [Lentithecium fluviatile CBS 122367]
MSTTTTDSTDTLLLIAFGVLTILIAIAGIHHRDSLCCLFCRSLHQAWNRETHSSYEQLRLQLCRCRCRRRSCDRHKNTQKTSRRYPHRTTTYFFHADLL